MISAESTPVKILYGVPKDPDVTYTYERGNNERWLTVLRVFLEGSYRDPPGMEPDSREDYEEDCCTIL